MQTENNEIEARVLEELYRLWQDKGGKGGVERQELARALGVQMSDVITAVDLLRLEGLVEPLTMRRLRITEAGIDRREGVAGVKEDDLQARQRILERLGEEFHVKGSRGIVYLKAEELGLDPIASERNFWYLARSGLIEGMGIGNVCRITAAGLYRLETAASMA